MNIHSFIKNNGWFLLIALLSLFLKVVLLLQGEVVNPDAATYLAAAERHSQGAFSEGFYYYRMPLYPLLLAATHFFIPDWILSGQLLTIFALVLSLWPLYLLTLRLFDQQAALWTALLFAILPEFNTLAIMRDPLFLLFALGALHSLVIFYQQKRIMRLAVFALLTALATLMRIEGVLLFLIATIPMFFYWWHLHRSGGNKTLTLVCLVLFFIIVAAAALWGVNVIGLSTKLRLNEVSRWGNDLRSLDFFSRYQHLIESIRNLQQTLPGGHLRNNLLEITRHYAPLIYCIGLFEVLAKAVFPTSLLAFWAYRWRDTGGKLTARWLMLLPWFAFVLLNVLFLVKRNFIQTRYFWIPIVLTLPWIGYGVSLWWQNRQPRKMVAIFVLAIIFMAPLSKTLATAAGSKGMVIVAAGNWLQNYDPQQKMVILYNDRRLPLYADRVTDVTKVRKLESLCKSVKRKKRVELVIVHLSGGKKINCIVAGFSPIKKFSSGQETVIVLKRQS